MLSSKKVRLKQLRNEWGKQVDRYRDFDLIAGYHSLLNPASTDYVDEKTWNDLEMDSVFTKMDRNISGPGQQYLYHLMHKYEKDDNQLNKRMVLISELKHNKALREKIQINLFNLTEDSTYFISYLVLSDTLPKTKYYRLFYILSALSVITTIMISINGVYLFVALGVLLTNIVVNKIFSRKIYEFFTGFSGLNSLIISALALSKIRSGKLPDELEYLKRNRRLLKSVKKKLGYLVIDKQAMNELAVIAIEYLNMFLLFDIIAYYRSVNILMKYQKDIRKVFETVANLDASISIASYLTENPKYSIPVFNDSGKIKFNNLYHPLINDAISNSIDELSKSALITGSNMSGKTTFIKTIGISLILSRTIYVSLAEEFTVPRLKVKSSIRRDEDLQEGKSYFFVEIELLNEFINLSKSGDQYLFIIDEIFRGTNTIERLASSTAVLKYLDAGNKVFCTTHDVELQDLLKDKFRMFHFSERVDNGSFYFDYKIQSGPCSSGNAIKLLEIMNYPESIIDESNSLVKKLLYDNNTLDKDNYEG